MNNIYEFSMNILKGAQPSTSRTPSNALPNLVEVDNENESVYDEMEERVEINESGDTPQNVVEGGEKKFFAEAFDKAKDMLGSNKNKNDEKRKVLELIDALSQKVDKYESVVTELKETKKKEENIEKERLLLPSIVPPIFPEIPLNKLTDNNSFRNYEMRVKTLKFTGDKGGLSVNEFLKSMNSLQSELKFSESDFRIALITRCTGRAHSLLTTWISMGYSTLELYVNLLNCFNREISPSKANEYLSSYRIPKFFNFSKFSAEVLELANVAASNSIDATMKESLINSLSLNCLIGRSPIGLKRVLETHMISFQQKRNQRPTFAEFLSFILPYNSILDYELLENSSKYDFAPPRDLFSILYVKEKGTSKEDSKSKFNKQKGTNGKSTNKISCTSNEVAINNGAESENTHVDNASLSFLNSLPAAHVNALNFSKTHNENQGGSSKGKGKLYCVFCGAQTHNSEQGCHLMVTDQLKKVFLTPGLKPCEICVTKLGRRFHHPTKFCPIRPALVEAYKKGTFKPIGIYKTYFEKNVKKD